MFNLSLSTGYLPLDWKLSTVTAIHKKGSKSEVSNYRPISLTCIVCNILKSLIVDKIMYYFTANNLLSKYQFGFVKGRSTVLQLLHLLDTRTKNLDKYEAIDVIYTDFEKAFDKVPHKKLILKLKKYGLSQQTLIWITEFLNNRRLRVKINNNYSRWENVTSGIPQDSVLGPLLFLIYIYINDMPLINKDLADLFLFADDAKLSKMIKIKDDKALLQNALNEVVDLSNIWLLSLNIIKCMVLCIRRNNESINEYIIYNNGVASELENVNHIKDLGVIIDNRLNLNEHINDKIKKANSMLGIIILNIWITLHFLHYIKVW